MMEAQRSASQFAGQIAARLDRLPCSRSLWRIVFLVSIGGALEFYDLFLSAYIAPGLVASGQFTSNAASLFSVNGVGFFVFCTFAGMWGGSVCFGSVSGRLGRRVIFIYFLILFSFSSALIGI